MKNSCPILTREQNDLLKSSMKKQVEALEKMLQDKSNFKTKDDWKKVSVISEGGDSA